MGVMIRCTSLTAALRASMLFLLCLTGCSSAYEMETRLLSLILLSRALAAASLAAFLFFHGETCNCSSTLQHSIEDNHKDSCSKHARQSHLPIHIKAQQAQHNNLSQTIQRSSSVSPFGLGSTSEKQQLMQALSDLGLA